MWEQFEIDAKIQFEISQIINGLHISGTGGLTQKKLIESNIKCILRMNMELAIKEQLEMFSNLKIKYYHIPTEDHPNYDILPIFSKTNKIILDNLQLGNEILVHCKEGVSRSVTVVCAFLLYFNFTCMKKSISVADVIALVQRGRHCAEPNTGFRKQLEQYHSVLECQLIKEK